MAQKRAAACTKMRALSPPELVAASRHDPSIHCDWGRRWCNGPHGPDPLAAARSWGLTSPRSIARPPPLPLHTPRLIHMRTHTHMQTGSQAYRSSVDPRALPPAPLKACSRIAPSWPSASWGPGLWRRAPARAPSTSSSRARPWCVALARSTQGSIEAAHLPTQPASLAKHMHLMPPPSHPPCPH
jgi:hypothetical protein